MDCVGSAVLSTCDSPADLSGTVATLFKSGAVTEVGMRQTCSIHRCSKREC